MTSKKKPKNSKHFSFTGTRALPKLTNVQSDWNLKKHFYTSERDARIETDIQKTEQAIRVFAKRYKNGAWTKSLKTILGAVRDYVALLELPGDKPAYYLSYRRELNAADAVADRLLNTLSDRLTKIENETIFFTIALAHIDKDTQKKLLADQNAAPYRYFLQNVFESAKFQRSEAEEKILNLKSLTSRSLWVSGTEKIINKKSISWKGKDMPIHGALMQFEQLPQKERHQMWNKIVPVLQSVGEVAENELVALALDKKMSDELRGYAKPYSATTRGYDSSDTTLETLVSVIETRGYELSKRFFTLKKKLLGRDLSYIDRNESVGTEPTIALDTAIDICRDVFYDFDTRYGSFFDSMLKDGCIDVWPKQGKGGGAFCSSGVNLPTLVFLNHNNSLESLRTLGHEMGHAIHALRSKSQPSLYQGHSILTAETASTFFEALVTERLIEQATKPEQLAIASGLIGDCIGTMIMCIARFKFELEMHETIRKEGGMSWREMSAGLAKHFAAYTGKAITTLPEHGLIVTSKPHYRMNFYQYSYSFGEIGSSIMRARYKADSAFKSQVDHFLSQGDSASVEAIFKSIGIDMSKAKTFELGLDLLEAEIDRFAALAKAA